MLPLKHSTKPKTRLTLTPLEQNIYFAAKNAKDGVVSLEIIRSWKLAGNNTLQVTLTNMVKKGWLARLRKGVYLLNESPGVAVKDPFSIATYIFPGYIAFSSALYIHKLTDTLPFEVQVATRNENGSRRIGEYTFRAIPLGKRYSLAKRENGCLVSTAPKTLYDCLAHPDLAGGYPQILNAINEAKLSETEWRELLYYAEKFEPPAFYQRLGYILELLPKKNNEINDIIKICHKKVKSNIYLSARRKGKYIPRWKLVDDIGKDELLGWWY
ncbi:hypothetical protein COT30_00520 [Candidatus Micrarchaeota archaeon CG08_land_8_20_14_0_20_49_17]|nr:MAG: hypothetical protein COT30_00520 [Candidatus Micrarchaeota archaeon CG08_land_8_20_14_0_20_49_17]